MVRTGNHLNKRTIRQIVEDGHFWHKDVRYVVMGLPAVKEGQVLTIEPTKMTVSSNKLG